MAPRSFLLTEQQAGYLVDHCGDPDELQRRLIAETQALGSVAGMQIAPDQGALLTLLARSVGAVAALEIGTFTGYSALSIVRGLAPGGRLLCCDVSEEWTAIARRYWAEAGVADRIDLRIGPALETLRALPPEATFDFVFLDADKPAYPDYWEAVAPRLRPGALFLADNVLRGGAVWDPAVTDDGTATVRRFNDTITADRRVESLIVPIGDGVTLARRLGDDDGEEQP